MTGHRAAGADVEQLIARAGYLLELDRPGEALAVLAPALAGDPGDVRLVCLAGLCHLGIGQTALAVARLGEAVTLAPDDDELHRLLSLALEKADDLEGSCHAAEEAVRLNPVSVEARTRLAQCLAEVPGRRPEAIENARWVVTCRPEDPAAHLVLAQTLLAAPGRHPRTDVAEARAAVDRAAALSPSSAEVARMRAWVSVRSARPGEAVRAATDAVLLDPSDHLNRQAADAVLTLGVALPYLVVWPAFLFLRGLGVYVAFAVTALVAAVYLMKVRRHRWRFLVDFARARPRLAAAEALLWAAALWVTSTLLASGPAWLPGAGALVLLLVGGVLVILDRPTTR